MSNAKAFYKSDRQRVEDAIIPSVLEALMLNHIQQLPEKDPTVYDKALGLLRQDLKDNIRNGQLSKRLLRLEKKILKFFESNGWEIRKAYMIMSYLAAALDESGAVLLGEGTKTVVKDMSDIISAHYHEEEIKKQDESAAKQVPKVLRLIQEEGYF